MFKKEITYTDFNGVTKTEEFLFNFSDAELVQMEMGVEGGSLSEKIKAVQRALDGRFIMDTFSDIILRSVGERSPDGSLFLKRNGAVAERFEASGAFSVLFLEILGDPEKAAAFMNSLVSPEALEKARKAAEEKKANEGKTPSEIARAKSEAALQGHLPTQTPEPQPVVQQSPVQPVLTAEELAQIQAARAQSEPAFAPVPSQEFTTKPDANQGQHFNVNQ